MADDRRAEARLAELPPGALGRYGRSSKKAAFQVRLGQFLLCLLVAMGVVRLSTASWINPGAVLLALLLNLALQQLFVLLNRRA